MDINDLRRERATINTRVQELAALEAAGTALTAEQLAEFDQLSARFAELGATISRMEQAERMAAAAAQPVDRASQGQGANAPPAYAQPRTPAVPGARVASMAIALIAAGGIPSVAAGIAEQRGYGEDVSMALSQSSAGAGGVLVPVNLAKEIIELLRPASTVRSLGVRSYPLMNGNATIPRINGGAVVGYVGVDSDIPATEQSFDDLKLSAKKLAALVPVGNDLLRNAAAGVAVEGIVVADITGAIGAREDKAFIRDNGSGDLPKGLLSWALSGNKIPASDASTLQKVETDLNKAILCLEGANSRLLAPGWIMAPRTFRFLEALRDGNGNKVYSELAQGMLKGYPIRRTTQIPVNLGSGGDESEIYFADFGDCFIGEDGTLMIDYSKEATYKDDEGNVVSAFQRDQTLIRVITHHDFGPRHVESIAVLTAVKWGK
ncbi:phage major capsid protein [Chitinimonas koreensis]|nr:phage major capsid protein [Chitinimonas koreensis]QNM98959.1 phage major capsid protein [Chitinimonas koreensis]